jgi:hypothetical protein
VHLVRFSGEGHLASYRRDARLAGLAAFRTSTIDRITILIGHDAPPYT